MGSVESRSEQTEPGPVSDNAIQVTDRYKSIFVRNIEQDENYDFREPRKDLDDAWKASCYCPKEQWGVGVVVMVDREAQGPKILQIIRDSPADKEDLRIGDMIMSIIEEDDRLDGPPDSDLSAVSLQYVYRKLRGEKVVPESLIQTLHGDIIFFVLSSAGHAYTPCNLKEDR